MRTFIRVQATSLLASGVDFLTTLACVYLWQCWYLLASVIGTICGGVVSFGIARTWTFAESNLAIGKQFRRFVLVWLGNAGINATGLFVATDVLGIQYVLAKVVIAIIVGISYNYVFQKDFVFSLS